MGKALQPVSVAGIEFDALISEERTLEANVPEYSVETGFTVSDSVIKKAETLNMVLFLTETPVTWKNRHGTGAGRVTQVCKQIEDLYFRSEPVTVITSENTYTDMAIESVSFQKSTEVGYAKEIPITFKKIRTTASKTAMIPDSYGKSGKTAAPAGTANVSKRNASSGGSGSGSGGSSNGEKGSILYHASQWAGWIPGGSK